VPANCSTPCDGNSNLTCGGNIENNSVYEILNPPYAYKGCYKDQQTRDLGVTIKGHFQNQTVQKCYEVCQKASYQYFALQHGH